MLQEKQRSKGNLTSNRTGLVRSPNELERIVSEHEKQKRLARLKKVRQQEKAIAAKRREVVQAGYGNEWLQTLTKARNQWLNDQATRIETLSNIYETAKSHQGDGHRSAESEEELKVHIQVQTRQLLIDRQKVESERSLESGTYFQQQEYQRIAPKLHQKALLAAIQKQEDARAAMLVEAYRTKMATTAPPIEIPSNPVYRVNQTQLARHTNKSHFENTYIHREVAVTRIQNEARSFGREVVENGSQVVGQRNVWEMAARESERAEKDRIQKQEREKHLQHLSKKRSEDSRRTHAMHKEKEQLLKSLQELQVEDRRRKQYNSALYSKQLKGGYLKLDKENLKNRFLSHFGFEEDQTPFISTAHDTTKKKIVPSGPSVSYHRQLSPESSIELVRDDEVEVYSTLRTHDNANQADEGL